MLGTSPVIRYALGEATDIDLRLIHRGLMRRVPIDWDKAKRLAEILRRMRRRSQSDQIQAVFHAETPVILGSAELEGMRVRRI
jgi:hypothetical protein